MKSDAFVDKPFKSREDVLAEIEFCAKSGGAVTLLSFGFAALGIISDALNISLVLEPMSWFLLAILAMVGSMGPLLHVVVAKHLLGMEVVGRKET